MSLSNEEKKQFEELVSHLKAIVNQENDLDYIYNAKFQALEVRINRLERLYGINDKQEVTP
jgi:exonuclease VII small subunit